MTRSGLRRVDPGARRGIAYRALAGLAGSRAGTWIATTRIWAAVIWPVDRALLRLSRGRLATGLLIRTALLQTRGAKTGRLRRTAVIYFHDGESVILAASKAGLPGNPSWFYNAMGNPDVELGGEAFHAELVAGSAEQARLWALADRVFPGYPTYRRKAAEHGREVPLVRLTPRPRQRQQDVSEGPTAGN